jgi:hypothetical protein
MTPYGLPFVPDLVLLGICIETKSQWDVLAC